MEAGPLTELHAQPPTEYECTRAYEVMLEVMSGTMNVSAAALVLGMPRNDFQDDAPSSDLEEALSTLARLAHQDEDDDEQ